MHVCVYMYVSLHHAYALIYTYKQIYTHTSQASLDNFQFHFQFRLLFARTNPTTKRLTQGFRMKCKLSGEPVSWPPTVASPVHSKIVKLSTDKCKWKCALIAFPWIANSFMQTFWARLSKAQNEMPWKLHWTVCLYQTFFPWDMQFRIHPLFMKWNEFSNNRLISLSKFKSNCSSLIYEMISVL